MERLGIEIDRSSLDTSRLCPLKDLLKWLDPYYVKAAKRLEDMIKQRKKEALARGEKEARLLLQFQS